MASFWLHASHSCRFMSGGKSYQYPFARGLMDPSADLDTDTRMFLVRNGTPILLSFIHALSSLLTLCCVYELYGKTKHRVGL
jgi:hypothetical protein